MNQPPNGQFGSDRQRDAGSDTNGYNSELRDSLPKSRSKEAAIEKSDKEGNSQSFSPRSNRRSKLSPQVMAIAIALTTLPPLAIATATHFSHKSLQQTLSQTSPDTTAIKQKLDREANYLVLMSWLAAIIAGGVSFWAVKRTLAPIIDAAAVSAMLVRRLRIQQLSSAAPASGKNVLTNLVENMQNLGERLPDLLSKQESSHEMLQVMARLTAGLRNAASEEEILRTTTDIVRQALRADRAVIFRYDNYPEGTFVAESTATGSPRLLWSKIDNYPFTQNYIPNSQPQVFAVDRVVQENLSSVDLALCQQLAIKAFLTAPIYRQGNIFGLIIVHQSHVERLWQPLELDLLSQMTNQVGLALESAKNLEQVAEQVNLADIFIKTTKIISSSLDEAEVLNSSVEAIRKVIASERLIVYGFDDKWYGTVLAESMSLGYPRMLWAGIYDPCFAEGFVEQYQGGRVKAVNDVYEADLGECYLKQLEEFSVKANLVAPIIKDGSLFGLLIAHQCSSSRVWQQWEIDWFAQIATQVGYALNRARLLKRIELEGRRSHLFSQLTRRIRGSMDFEEIVKIGVEETRKAISADRVIILVLQADGSGDVAAESVAPGLPHAIAHKFSPSWVPIPLKQAYQRGQVIATDDVFASQFNNEQIELLERLKIKSSLSAPILLKNERLFALVIAHQCTQSRQWESQEIEMFAQIATQIGYAIEPIQLINEVEQEYQSTASASLEQRRQLAMVEVQLTELLERNKSLAQELQHESPNNMKIVTHTYSNLQTLANLSQKIVTAAEQTKIREQHISEMLQVQFNAIYSLQTQNSALRDTGNQAAQTVQEIQLPIDRLSQSIDLIGQIANQLKLQSVNVALEVSRYGKDGQKLREIAEKVMNYLRQLEADLQEVKPLLENIQTQSQRAATALQNSSETALISSQLLNSTQQELDGILAVTNEIRLLADGILQSASEQSSSLQSVSDDAMVLAQTMSSKTRPSEAIYQSIDKISSLIGLLHNISK